MSIAKGIFAAGGSDEDPEKWVYDKIRHLFGGQAEDLARFGLMGLLTGTDMSGSLGTMIDMPGTWSDILGPIGGLGRDVLQGIGFLAGGQPGRAAEKMLPTGVSKLLQAVREGSQGVTTSKNFPVIGEDGQRLVPTAGESAAKALGFRPLREAKARERTSEAIEEERRYGEKRDRIYARFRAFVLSGGKDVEERQAIVKAVGEFNQAVSGAGLSGRVPAITRESLLRQTERLAKPTTRELARLDAAGGAKARQPEALTEGDVEGLSHPFYAVRRAYAQAKQRYDAARETGDHAEAMRVRAATKLPRLRMLVGRVQAVHEEMGKVRKSRLSEEEKARRLARLKDRERREMDRAAQMASGLAAASGEIGRAHV